MRVRVLGGAQDGGVPHLGCRCSRCDRARRDPEYRRYPTAFLFRDGDAEVLVDAPPDLRHRLATVPDAVVLTHAHLGHLPGILSFGREAANAENLTVHCTAGMATVLRENAPFSHLLDRGTLSVRTVEDGDRVAVGDHALRVRRVPHREALPTGTLSVLADGGARSLYAASDVDHWTDRTEATVGEADVALLDGTFWSADEVDRVETVPHPTVRDSMDRFGDVDTDVRFVHLNHTNPLFDADSPERRRLTERGFGVVTGGSTFEL